jgi:AraC-like DNA-binding protein
VGGARSCFYAKEIGVEVVSIGAALRPGVAQILFGASAVELAQRDTPLYDLSGLRANDAMEQLLDVPSPQQQLKVLGNLLAAQLPKLNSLSPKRYVRLMRFQTLLATLRSQPSSTLTDLALESGYSDQAHMSREFREFAGITPTQYRVQSPIISNHAQIRTTKVKFIQDN